MIFPGASSSCSVQPLVNHLAFENDLLLSDFSTSLRVYRALDFSGAVASSRSNAADESGVNG